MNDEKTDLSQEQARDILAAMSVDEQTSIIIYILAGDKDCKIINEVRRALIGWGMLPLSEAVQGIVDEMREEQAVINKKQERRIERLETTRARPGIAPRNIYRRPTDFLRCGKGK